MLQKTEIVSEEYFEEITGVLTSSVLHTLSKTKPEVVFYRYFDISEIVVVSSVDSDTFVLLFQESFLLSWTISLHVAHIQTIIFQDISSVFPLERFLPFTKPPLRWLENSDFLQIQLPFNFGIQGFCSIYKDHQVSGSNTAAVKLCLTGKS